MRAESHMPQGLTIQQQRPTPLPGGEHQLAGSVTFFAWWCMAGKHAIAKLPTAWRLSAPKEVPIFLLLVFHLNIAEYCCQHETTAATVS
jgi:hypothetical protein